MILLAPACYYSEEPNRINIPDWCPLETYVETEHTTAPAQPEERGTIVLPGLPHLEWMTENLKGFGGTEIDGRTYYTYDEAVEAVKQLGNGWRLPTRGELVDLDDLGSTWDEERRGRWFGGNHDTDHEGSLFLPASGYRGSTSGALNGVGAQGLCWSSSPTAAGNANAGHLGFRSGVVLPLNSNGRAFGFTVRCVRNRQ
ncbi:MAG: fibrobacter succinogenes major paralogous domain-containing protein [Bacteroides cellulosilyticus]|nr:fibrobacter succinogenes major paralogous domain-containing protein [Bacteroides cellulosilyticus]